VSSRAILAGGSLPNLATEATVRMHSSTLHVELLGDTWRADLAPNATGNTSGSLATRAWRVTELTTCAGATVAL
jgi:hypothetical protein